MIFPSYETFCQKAKEGNLIPVYRQIQADTETPVSAFLKIRESPYAFLLESVEGGEKWGRYSFLGDHPTAIIRGEGGRTTITRDGESRDVPTTGNPLHVLKEMLAEFKPVSVEGLPRFCGGAVGFIGYGAVRFFESVNIKDRGETDFLFLVIHNLLIFDNVRHRILVVANADTRGGDLKAAYDRAVAEIDRRVAVLGRPISAVALPAEAPPPSPLPQASNLTRDQFKSAVSAAQEYIRAGDLFQVVLSQRFDTPFSGDPFTVYRALRGLNPSPYLFYLQFDQRHLVGASPEVLVRLEGKIVSLRPIAGTRRRGESPEEDRALEQELLADPKERAEHLMLVDLGRNDVGRVCDYGTVVVDTLMAIERYSHVMHIVSNITGRLEGGKDAFDVLAASFPAGTVTGAPKIRAMEIIDQLEPTGRGPYAGSVGYFDWNGNMEMCITIRTIAIDGNRASVQAGAGIVADSDPDAEYQETLNKAQAMRVAIEMAREGIA
jgi:anthranilate synthase component 1